MTSLFTNKIIGFLKIGLSVFFVICVLGAFAEKPLTHSATTEENGRVYQYSIVYQEISIKVKPFVTYFWHRNGQLRSTTGDYSGNVLHGVSQEFDKSGRLMEKGTYHYGTKDGIWKSWDRNGKIIRLEKWNRGLLCWRKSYDGPRYTLENFKKNQLNGRKIIWSAGQKKSIEHFKNGEKCKQSKKSLKSYLIHKKQTKEANVAEEK